MKKTIRSIILTSLSIFAITAAQAQDDGTELNLARVKPFDVEYFEYPPETKLYFSLKDSSDVARKYPEETLWSDLCATNFQWTKSLYVKYWRESAPDEAYLTEKKRTEKGNYIELLSKFTFNLDGTKMVLIKYYYKYENIGKKGTSKEVFEKRNGKWLISDDRRLNEIKTTIWALDQQYISEIMLRKKSQLNLVNTVISESYVGNVLDFDLLIKSIVNHESDPDVKMLSDKFLN